MRLHALLAVFAAFALPVSAAEIAALAEIPPASAQSHPDLVKRRAELVRERADLRARTDSHNARCRAVEVGSAAEGACQSNLAALRSDLGTHVSASNSFNSALQAAVAAARQAAVVPSAITQADVDRVLNGINDLARRLGWSAEERDRLNRALTSLDADGAPIRTNDPRIRQAWTDMLARDRDGELARLAAAGDGPGFPGAGLQTRFQDCAVFALANAANLPYSVVAARAAEIIREGNWRSAEERANAQKTIERGLIGGEVIMLAEAFGRADIVRSPDFARTLRDGRRLMVSVVPASGGNMGHQVVLSKTFRHHNETWYELIDSNQGPDRRLYLNDRELQLILRETAIAFRPDPGRTPALLR